MVQDMARKSWREISSTLGKDENACRAKWKYLRDRYVKAKRKRKRISGDTGGLTSRAHIIAGLDWLAEFIKHRHVDPISLKECEDSAAAMQLEAMAAAAPRLVPSGNLPMLAGDSPLAPVSPTTSSSSSGLRPQRPRKRKEHPTPVEEATLKALQTLGQRTLEPQREEPFCRMIGEMLQQLPKWKQLDVKFAMHRLLYEAILECRALEN